MLLGTIKPLLATLVLPPAGPLLLMLVGALIWRFTRKAKSGIALTILGFLLAWLLCCQAVAVILNERLLQSHPVATVQSAAQQRMQAVVVLGSGIQPFAPEYANHPQPSKLAAVRLRYGAWFAAQTALPLAFSGGRGWASDSANPHTEADAAAWYLKAFNLPPAQWLDGKSADTFENAQQMALKLQPQNIRRIVLVTHAWHMERSVKLFEAAGFTVLPAPMNAIAGEAYALLNWLPSADGLQDSRQVLREWLALWVLRAAQ